MNRGDLRLRIVERKKALGLTMEQIANLTGLGCRTVARFMSGNDVKLSTVEKITNLLGLDFAGNEIVTVEELLERRAEKKALYIVALVQDDPSLREQEFNDENSLNGLLEFIKNRFLNEDRKLLWVS